MIYRLPPLNALRVFEAAARHLSFKEAAQELSITQAAVSHQIKSLEEYLGVELFRRAGRGVQLTEAARASGPGRYPASRADHLSDVATIAVASPELARNHPGLREPADLAHHVLLHDEAMDLVTHGDAWQKWLEAAGVADRVDGSRGPHFSSNILSLEAASQKLGVALALKPLVNDDIESGQLWAPFKEELKPQSAYYLVCPEVIAERPAVAAFRKWLLEQAANT